MTFRFHPYVSHKQPCSGGAQPGAKALMKVGMELFGATNLGIYNCRSIRGSSKLSSHAKGLGVDFGFPPEGGKGSKAGQKMMQALVENAYDLGITFVKFGAKGEVSKDGRLGQFSARQNTGNPVGDSLHANHIHVELHPHYGANLTAATVRAILEQQPPKVFDQAVLVSTQVDHGMVVEFAAQRNLGVLQVADAGRLIDTASGQDAAVGSWALVVGGLAERRNPDVPASTTLVGATRVETQAMVDEFAADHPVDGWPRRGNPTV